MIGRDGDDRRGAGMGEIIESAGEPEFSSSFEQEGGAREGG